jgi:hypothetical protein
MRKIIILAAVIAMMLCVGGYAVVTSFGTITGYATVKPAFSFDILESYSDVNTTATDDSSYTLEPAYPGETKWVEIKIKNAASSPLISNITLTTNAECDLSLWNKDKTVMFSNPVNITSGDFYIWIKHTFKTSASLGQYSFTIDLLPA